MDSRIRMSRWLLLVATVLLWAAVVVSVVAGAGLPWVTLGLAVVCTAMAALVWFRLS